MKLLLVVNVDWFFLSHRLPIALEGVKRGWDVYILTKDTGKFDEIKKHGLKPINLDVERSGKNVLREFRVISSLVKVYRDINPDVVHHVTMKISIYGSIAARKAGIKKVVNAISGLGFNFTADRKSLTQKVILQLMRHAFRNRGLTFIFQNPDDLDMFQQLGLAENNQSVLIKGSGVDLDEFKKSPQPGRDKLRFVMTARMLRDKGVGEYINAATSVEKELPGKGEWQLVGGLDPENPAGYTESELNILLKETPVEWLGYRSDIADILANANVMVLPSYREGLPKSLIEAAAIGRPIITTDTVGCRECVDDEVNGFLVPVQDSEKLAQSMIKLLNDADLREKMGDASRKKAEQEFSIRSVLDKTFELYG